MWVTKKLPEEAGGGAGSQQFKLSTQLMWADFEVS